MTRRIVYGIGLWLTLAGTRQLMPTNTAPADSKSQPPP